MPRDKEQETSFHIVVLAAFTVMCALLDVIIVISDWGALAVLPVTLSVALCWGVHFLDIGKDSVRLYFYVLVMLCILGYYTAQGPTITDVPIQLCLLLILLSRQNDKKLVILVAASYLVYLVESIFVIRFITPDTEQIVFARIALGLFSLLFAMAISLFFMKLGTQNIGEKERLLKEVEDAKDESKRFLSNMSHELRTPINVVNGISELMLSEKRSKEDVENLSSISEAVGHLHRQVSDILSYSEIQSGYFRLSEDDYEIVSVVNDAVGSIFEHEGRGLDFAVDIAPDIPRVLRGDSRRLKKLISILTDNAVKFTQIGGGYIYLSKRDTDYGINLNIDIYDTGRGMDMDAVDEYKNGVYASDTSTERKRGGLGLGLYIAHGIVNAMQGFMSIQSSDEGTHVHLTIPQKVIDRTPSITLEGADSYHAVLWFDRKKYIRREVGEYYYRVVQHMIKGLRVSAEIADSLANLKKLAASHKVTHIFIAEKEYETDPGFFESAAGDKWVCVFADPDFRLDAGSRISVIPKPVYLLSVLSYLKNSEPGKATSALSQTDEIGNLVFKEGVRVLVVDDEKMNVMVAKGILEKLGVEVLSAESGMEAVDICNAKDFDIIFMDYMMPGLNGSDAMKRIRQLRHGFYENCPIVVLTANAVSGAREELLTDGFDDFLAKPVGMKEMAKCMKRFLGSELKSEI